MAAGAAGLSARDPRSAGGDADDVTRPRVRRGVKGGAVVDAADGLGVCRLPHDAVSRRARPDAGLRQGRLRSDRSSTSSSTPRRTRWCSVSAWPRRATSSRSSVTTRRTRPARANPVAGAVTHAIAIGDSQSGNFIKTFVHLGFNQDLSGRMVWDGVFPRIAARQTPMNFRFALPGGAADALRARQRAGRVVGTVRGHHPRTTRRPACSIAAPPRADCPKVIEAFGSTEFWGLRMSPGLIGTDAGSGHPAARQRAPLLLSGHDPRRRPRRIPRRSRQVRQGTARCPPIRIRRPTPPGR